MYMYKKEDTTLEPSLTTPTHWSCEQLPPLQLKKEVCTEGDTNMMATAPNSPFLPGTGSMGELSQNSSVIVDVQVHPIWYPITTIWVLFWTE